MNRTLLIGTLALLFAILAAVVRSGPLPGDETIGRALLDGGRYSEAVSRVASLLVWTPVVLILGAGLRATGSRRDGVLLVATELSAELASYIVKELVNRPRPTFDVVDEITASFPSNSVVRVAVTIGVLALIVSWRWRGWRQVATLVAVVLAAVVGVARVASGEHWPSDVLGAYLLAGVGIVIANRVGGQPRTGPVDAERARAGVT